MKIGIALWFFAVVSASDVVTRPVANLYKGPDSNVEVVSQAIYGTEVETLEEKQEWIRARTPDGYTGWMSRDDLAHPAPTRPGTVFVTAANLFVNLYPEPSISKHAPVLVVPYETKLAIASEPKQPNNRWLEVNLVDGRTAWVEQTNVTKHSEKLNISSTIAHAKRFIGLPYLWGGVSSFGFDCSGFMQMLARRRGVTLPRDARQQIHWDGFVPVERSAWRPGDLLYFGRSIQRITHTGMYIGQGMMIHAASPCIRIQAVDEVAESRGMVFGRRIK